MSASRTVPVARIPVAALAYRTNNGASRGGTGDTRGHEQFNGNTLRPVQQKHSITHLRYQQSGYCIRAMSVVAPENRLAAIHPVQR